MTSRALAWRTLTANPARALLAVAGVAVIGALLFDMLMLSSGLLVSFRDLLDTAGYDVRVVAPDGPPVLRVPIPHATALAADLSRLPEVQEVAVFRMDRVVMTMSGRRSQGVTLISVSEGAERHTWRITRGENVITGEGALEQRSLVVSERLATALSLAPGSTLRVRPPINGAASAIPEMEFHVAGVAEFEFAMADELTAATTRDGFDLVRAGGAPGDPGDPGDQGNPGNPGNPGNKDEADAVLIASRPALGSEAAVTAINRLRPDLRAYSNEQLVAQFNQNGFAYFRQISFVLSSITLGFAFLLVATLLTVSVNQRLSEMAALRALGFPRRRIAATLLWESAWLVGVGGLLALPLGGLLALELDRILRAMPGLPERMHFFVFEPRAVVLYIALLTVTGLGAAAYPVWVAARLPIAATLRREVVS
jgi:putative ABC transport system permease protein